jgi:hypothetical protein
MYALSLLKLSNFLWQYYGQIFVFISFFKKIDQISILLSLLCGNLELESLNCP